MNVVDRLREDGMTFREIGERLGISSHLAWYRSSVGQKYYKSKERKKAVRMSNRKYHETEKYKQYQRKYSHTDEYRARRRAYYREYHRKKREQRDLNF